MNQLIILLPLIGSALVGLTGLFVPAFRKQEGLIGGLATLAVAVPFFVLLGLFMSYNGPVSFTLMEWMTGGNLSLSFSYSIDSLSLLMGLVVTGVGALIHLYSIGYMHGDEGFYKYFAYLNLFIFAMLNLVLGDNLAVMFLGWEGVGACSYFLIGFWYRDMAKSEAAQKAFVANRIGDFAMLVAMFIVYQTVGSLRFEDINAGIGMFGDKTMWVALLVFFAATGKSAQIPLFVWLPDAMAGPTPVSALIHAATMVTSGIYLIARLHPVFEAAPEVLAVVGVVAAATALMAALIAIAQNDIKKVLAYSTVSQLGFMFMALSAGAYTTAIFHVFTHAFFKACLFLGSGSVIHAMEHGHAAHDPQDIRFMGGLRGSMRSTALTFWISTLAIAGIPLLSGFFSKDEILASLFFRGEGLYYGVWGVATLTAALTAFYMTRLTYLTFEGKSRFEKADAHVHESGPLMTIPLWILAGFAALAGFLGLPEVLGHNWIGHAWLGQTVLNNPEIHHHAEANPAMEWMLMGLSSAIAVVAVWFAVRFYGKHGVAGDAIVKKSFGGLYKAMENKFYVDEFYESLVVKPFMALGRLILKPIENTVIDGAVEGSATVTGFAGDIMRRLQTGWVNHYALLLSAGVVALLGWLILG